MPNIIEDKKKILFDAVSKDYNIGTFDEFSKKLEDDSKRKSFYEGVGAEYNLGSYSDFETKISVKKKAESGSSLDISAGPYASGQKPKGFSDIVSEKISEVSPIEKAKAKEDDFVRKQSEKELSKKDTYAKAAIRGAKTLGTTVITGLKDLDTGLSILGKKARDTFGIKDTDLDEELESKLDDNQVVSIVRDYQKKVDNQAQEIQKLREQTGGSGITENISKGNYAKALDYTGKTFVESLAPSLMFLTPLTATMSMGKTVGDEMQQAKSEGRIPTATDVTAGIIKGAAEYALTAFLGVGKVTKKAVSETLFRKEASDAITKMVKSSFGKKVATTIGEEGFEEGFAKVINNGVDIVLKGDKTKGWFDDVPDNVIVGMFGGGTQGTIANLILDKAEKEQAKEAAPTTPELPPDTGGGATPKLDLQNLDPYIRSDIESDKESLEDELRFNEERADANKPKNILEKGAKGVEKILGLRDLHKEYTNKAEDTKRQLDLLENNPIAYYEEKIADFNKQLEESKDDEKTEYIEYSIKNYEGIIEDLKNEEQSQEQAVPLSDDINSQFGESSDFISGLIDELTEATESEYPSQRNADQYLALLKYNPKKYLKNRINYYTRLDNESGDNYWSETIIPKFQKALDDLEKNKLSPQESQNQPLTQEENAVQIESTSSEVPPIGETGQIIPQGSEGVRQGEQGIETTQQGGQEEIGIISDAVNELQQNNVLLTINDIPVSIQVTNEGIVATDLETGDSVLVNSDDVLVDGQYPLTDVINEYIGQSEQQQQQQQQASPTELPKKIFHATKASFEGLPSRQEQSKVSAFGTEPAGTFYSTNPDRAKQAIGDGGDARIIEADFNPKNPLVIENTDNEVYSNIKNESQQQAIQELNDKYIESGVDLTTLEEGELPEEVNKRTTEIFADKLKEQGYDAVINNENGDIIVLDNTVVTEKKAEPKAAPTNEIEKSQQIQELKDELNALDAQDDSKLSEKERKRIKNAIRYTVTSIARGYFLDGGKILWDSLKKETGFKGGEFKDFLGVVSKTGRTVDGIANYLWENGDNDKFESEDYRNAIIEVLSEPRDEWYVRQRNEVDADSNQNILEQKQKIQEQIDILEDADLSFEDIKNELEANEAMWQQKFEQEGVPKQKSGTFVNKELESDIPKALEYLAKMKELEDGTKKRNMQSKIDEITAKDPKLKKIIENFDTILKQLNYTSNC